MSAWGLALILTREYLGPFYCCEGFILGAFFLSLLKGGKDGECERHVGNAVMRIVGSSSREVQRFSCLDYVPISKESNDAGW